MESGQKKNWSLRRGTITAAEIKTILELIIANTHFLTISRLELKLLVRQIYTFPFAQGMIVLRIKVNGDHLEPQEREKEVFSTTLP